jgi:hypothetical protein
MIFTGHEVLGPNSRLAANSVKAPSKSTTGCCSFPRRVCKGIARISKKVPEGHPAALGDGGSYTSYAQRIEAADHLKTSETSR